MNELKKSEKRRNRFIALALTTLLGTGTVGPAIINWLTNKTIEEMRAQDTTVIDALNEQKLRAEVIKISLSSIRNAESNDYDSEDTKTNLRTISKELEKLFLKKVEDALPDSMKNKTIEMNKEAINVNGGEYTIEYGENDENGEGNSMKEIVETYLRAKENINKAIKDGLTAELLERIAADSQKTITNAGKIILYDTLLNQWIVADTNLKEPNGKHKGGSNEKEL